MVRPRPLVDASNLYNMYLEPSCYVSMTKRTRQSIHLGQPISVSTKSALMKRMRNANCPGAPARNRSPRVPAPARNRSPSVPAPARNRSPSVRVPVHNHDRSPSSARNRSPSPAHNQSPSPARNRSPSPARNRSPSGPARNRSPSGPARNQSPSPARNRSPPGPLQYNRLYKELEGHLKSKKSASNSRKSILDTLKKYGTRFNKKTPSQDNLKRILRNLGFINHNLGKKFPHKI